METEEISNIAISPLIVSPFAVQWSEDNHISVLTEKGVHVFELMPSPTSSQYSIRFVRTFIYPPSIFPAEYPFVKINSKIWTMDRREIYSLIMEESLTPKLTDINEMIPRIVRVAWSPPNLIHPSKCLLAILTSTGAIMILHKMSMDWYTAYDLCSVYSATKENEIIEYLKSDKAILDPYTAAKSCIKELQASTMTWSELYVSFAYLAVSYGNGDIVIYKTSRILSLDTMSVPNIVGKASLKEPSKITVLSWVTISAREYLIVIGYFDGRINGLKLEDFEGTLKVVSLDTYHKYPDRISITSIELLSQNESYIKILLSKGTFLILLCFTANGTLQTMQHIQTEGFMITGLTIISNNDALVTTENGIIYKVNVQTDNIMKFEGKNVHSQGNVRYLGLAHSPSQVLFVNVLSPNTIYDHLVLKEPSKMNLFALNHDNWNPLKILKKNEHKRFAMSWDCFEVLRMRAAKAPEPSMVMPKVPSNLEMLSLYQLRVAMWILVITEVCEERKVIQGIGHIAGEISEAQPIIFIQIICDYLERIQEEAYLSDEQKLSAHLLRMYLEVYLAGEETEEASPVSKRARRVLDSTLRLGYKEIETCNLCGELINDLSWNITKCPQGHVLPRCAITLLQLTTVKYKYCPICGLLFHPCLDEVYEEVRCLFCDVPTMLDNRVFNDETYICPEKSLSKPQIRASEGMEEKEAESQK